MQEKVVEPFTIKNQRPLTFNLFQLATSAAAVMEEEAAAATAAGPLAGLAAVVVVVAGNPAVAG